MLIGAAVHQELLPVALGDKANEGPSRPRKKNEEKNANHQRNSQKLVAWSGFHSFEPYVLHTYAYLYVYIYTYIRVGDTSLMWINQTPSNRHSCHMTTPGLPSVPCNKSSIKPRLRSPAPSPPPSPPSAGARATSALRKAPGR